MAAGDRMSRLEQLRGLMRENRLDGYLVTGAENRRYLSGFTGSNGVLVIGEKTEVLVTDFRYLTQVREEAPGFAVRRQEESLWETVAAVLRELGMKQVGFEAEYMVVDEFFKLKAIVPEELLVPSPGLVARLRGIKDPVEIEGIRRAVAVADAAWQEVLPTIQAGDVERDVALRLETALRRLGASGPSFATIVASGPRSALPHGEAGDRRLAPGDLVVLDFGCVFHGYCSDITRTVVVNTATPRQQEIYDLVLQAQLTAIAGLRPGMTGREGDRLSRAVIEEAGYGEYFGHGLGHSLGLAIHENPRLSPKEGAVLEPGMVLTVEPGIYLPDWGGVRIEDVVVITETGCEVLTKADKSFTVIQ